MVSGKTLQPSRSMIDGSIFDAHLMSCCNLCEYLPAKKDIKEFSSIAEALEVLTPPGFGTGVYQTNTMKRMYHATPRCLKQFQS